MSTPAGCCRPGCILAAPRLRVASWSAGSTWAPAVQAAAGRQEGRRGQGGQQLPPAVASRGLWQRDRQRSRPEVLIVVRFPTVPPGSDPARSPWPQAARWLLRCSVPSSRRLTLLLCNFAAGTIFFSLCTSSGSSTSGTCAAVSSRTRESLLRSLALWHSPSPRTTVNGLGASWPHKCADCVLPSGLLMVVY